ncbi:hypothetical protein JCM11251_001112 [Rhodosporidiobolus azoricus]
MSALQPGLPVVAMPADASNAQNAAPPPSSPSTSTPPARRPSAPSSEHTLADHDSVDLEKGEGKKESPDSEGVNEKAANKGSKSGAPGGGPPAEEEDPFLVTLKGRDHLNPHTWAVWYRWALTGVAGLLVLNATFASSAPSGLIPDLMERFDVSQEVGVLTISIFVAGYCVGPLLWGPLSERYGRRLVFLFVWPFYTGFQVGCALSPNIGALLVFRFLGGCFASSPLTNSGGVIADLWDADRRGDALAIFALMPFAGPALAPMISGFMAVRGVNWPWIFWLLTCFAGLCAFFIVFALPETYVPYILHVEAKRLRKETGDDRWHSPMDKKEAEGIKAVLDRTVLKPFRMIVEEPMLLVITLYMSFVYGIVYLLFEAIPIVFEGQYGLNAGQSGMVFLALLSGGFLAVCLYIGYFNRVYMKKHHAMRPKMVPPEVRLQPLLYAAPLLAVSFFWFGWTGAWGDSVSKWSPIVAIGTLGGTVLFVFLSGFNYLIDCYLWNAASALAINTVVRSAFGAGFPLFSNQMFSTLTIQGASSLLGGIAIIFVPVPFLLMKYGKRIRGMSKNAVVLDGPKD